MRGIVNVSAIPISKASALDRGMVVVSGVHRNHTVPTDDLSHGVRLGPVRLGFAAIAAVALRGLVLIVIATLLVLVILPAALVAAGT